MLRRSSAPATQVVLCKSKWQKLENTKIVNRRAPSYLRRREEVAAAGRDPPPDLAVMVDNERQQAAAGLKRAVAMAKSCGYGRGGRRRVVAWQGEEEEEERWVSSAPSWVAESTFSVPKTWRVSHQIFGFLP